LRPRLIASTPRALVQRLPAAELRKQRVALQLDVTDTPANHQDRHPVSAFLRSIRARTYTISVGKPKAK